MSEEKPTFKVTDRRLFNADGTPREDIPREEEPTADAAASTPEVGAGGASAAAAPEPSGETRARDESRAGRADAGGLGQSPGVAAAEEPEAGEDPQEFLMVVEFIASFAADALGMVAHPGGPRGEVNLPLARQCIDMLGALQRKTRGNLTAEEQRFFEMILSQLRMQYVSLTNAPRGPQGGGGRGFTGSDITGGR
jgi:hypothetical protein